MKHVPIDPHQTSEIDPYRTSEIDPHQTSALDRAGSTDFPSEFLKFDNWIAATDIDVPSPPQKNPTDAQR